MGRCGALRPVGDSLSLRAAPLVSFLALACAERAPLSLEPVSPYVGDPIPLGITLEIPADTASIRYAIPGSTGTEILLGEAFEQYARAYLERAFEKGDDVRVAASLATFEARNGRFSIAADLRVARSGREVFQRRYNGTSHGNTWDESFADRRTYWREAANLALRSVFKQFIDDARRDHTSW